MQTQLSIRNYSAEAASSYGANRMVNFPARLDVQPYPQKFFLLEGPQAFHTKRYTIPRIIIGEWERANLVVRSGGFLLVGESRVFLASRSEPTGDDTAQPTVWPIAKLANRW